MRVNRVYYTASSDGTSQWKLGASLTVTEEDVEAFEREVDRLIAELEESDQPKSNKKNKTKLTLEQMDEISSNYWSGRYDDREQSTIEAMQWVIWAFLHVSDDKGRGRTHEFRSDASLDALKSKLISSAEHMRHDVKCKIEMRPPCWWDVQEHHHNVIRRQIHSLAERIHMRLVDEAIERLIARGHIWHHCGYWQLSTNVSRDFIVRQKARGKWRAADLIAA